MTAKAKFSKHGIDDKSFFPFVLIDARKSEYGDVRLSFDNWEWLEDLIGGDTVDNETLNGYEIQNFIIACRDAAGLEVESESIDYNSEGDTCFIHFESLAEAERTAELAAKSFKTRAKAISLIRKGRSPRARPAKQRKKTSGRRIKPMKRDQFWEIIARTNPDAGNMNPSRELLRNELSSLSADEILSFIQTAENLLVRAYTWDLRAAADLIDGGCSDYSFRYFSLYLVANGRQRFERALKNADSLAEWANCDDSDDELTSIAAEILCAKTGEDFPSDLIMKELPDQPAGKPYKSDDLYLRVPKLTKRFASNLIPKKKVKARCPGCKTLLRSDLAKQCVKCGADWHTK